MGGLCWLSQGLSSYPGVGGRIYLHCGRPRRPQSYYFAVMRKTGDVEVLVKHTLRSQEKQLTVGVDKKGNFMWIP